MQYLLLIYDEEVPITDRGISQEAFMGQYRDFTERIVASGEFKAGEALQPTGTATSVRVRDGEVLMTDGPFAETREALGGFYLVEADDLDRAVEIASRIPTARYGTIEVRPLLAWDD